MFNTYYLGKIKKQFWATMDDHIGARVVFKFFFPLLKINARRIQDAWAMANFIVKSSDYISPVQKARLQELKSHQTKRLRGKKVDSPLTFLITN